MIEIYSIIPWLGMLAVILSTWAFSTKRLKLGFVLNMVGSVCWSLVGISTFFDVKIELPSLVVMNCIIFILSARGLYFTKK